MRPAATNSTSVAAVSWHWNSPIPYLFGGLALMLGLITVALIILACSCRKSLANSRSDLQAAAEKPACKKVTAGVESSEPKIVVIMAGDENPTYLAKPVFCKFCQAATTATTNDQEQD